MSYLYKQKEEEIVFSDISQRPVPSLLRGYSAPVLLESDLTDNDNDLSFLLAMIQTSSISTEVFIIIFLSLLLIEYIIKFYHLSFLCLAGRLARY